MPNEESLPADGRQSEAALRIARGTRRLLHQLRFYSIQEMTLPSGLRADIVALGRDGEILIIEIKSSLADYHADQKWTGYRSYCDRFFFAVSEDFPQSILPPTSGVIIADAYGADMIRTADEHRLPAARRKSILLRFSHTAAERLHQMWDQERDT